MTHQICDACECVSHCRKNGCVPLTMIDQAPKFAIPPSSDVATLQRELSFAFEMLVRARELTKELSEALGGLMDLECRGRIMPTGKEWDAARAALMKVPQ